jgi:hypothetical protein
MRHLKLFEYFKADEITTSEELISKLAEYKIPYESWGKGYAKTVDHLLDELKNDECAIIDEQGYLVRYIEFVGIKVFYKTEDGAKYYLKEDRQVFRDGRTRRRTMQASVSEKMKFGEDPELSAIRGIAEELEINVDSDQLVKRRDLHYDGGSQSYPGLKSKYKGHVFNCNIRKDQYNPEGYVERQKDKSTYFVWEKI